MKATENALCQDFKDKQRIDQVDIQSLFFAFVNRQRFKYSLRDVLRYLFKCICLKDLDKHKRDPEVKPHFLFEKAEDKLCSELDVVRIVRALRKFRMLSQALLHQRHRLILRFQRENLIETSTSSSNSEDEIYEPMRTMEHEEPYVRLYAYGNVKRMMKEFKGRKIENMEAHLMRGMFKRKLKDFNEKI